MVRILSLIHISNPCRSRPFTAPEAVQDKTEDKNSQRAADAHEVFRERHVALGRRVIVIAEQKNSVGDAELFLRRLRQAKANIHRFELDLSLIHI